MLKCFCPLGGRSARRLLRNECVLGESCARRVCCWVFVIPADIVPAEGPRPKKKEWTKRKVTLWEPTKAEGETSWVRRLRYKTENQESRPWV